MSMCLKSIKHNISYRCSKPHPGSENTNYYLWDFQVKKNSGETGDVCGIWCLHRMWRKVCKLAVGAWWPQKTARLGAECR